MELDSVVCSNLPNILRVTSIFSASKFLSPYRNFQPCKDPPLIRTFPIVHIPNATPQSKFPKVLKGVVLSISHDCFMNHRLSVETVLGYIYAQLVL
jgi:hypothetical protein